MTNNYFMGIDVGGTHITLALVDSTTFEMLPESTIRRELDTNASPSTILKVFESAIASCVAFTAKKGILGVGLAIPGPFNYNEGVCKITPAQQKYEQMFGVDLRTTLSSVLGRDKPIIFNNDAACFAMGEYFRGGAQGFDNSIVVTLGTGFGASFLEKGDPRRSGEGVTEGGELWDVPWREGIADDYFTTRGLINEWKARTGEELTGAKEIAELAQAGNVTAMNVFNDFGADLAEFIAPWLKGFNSEAFVIGGNIARSWDLFVPALEKKLTERISNPVAVKPCTLGEQAPIYGAALALTITDRTAAVPAPLTSSIRTDPILKAALRTKNLILDGPVGTPWKALVMALDSQLRGHAIEAVWLDISAAYTAEGTLDSRLLAALRCDSSAPLSVLYGNGSSLAQWHDAIRVEVE